MLKNYKLTIAYDGTAYAGWQTQDNALSVQETLSKVLHRILQEKVRLIGASRTDAGAHAIGQAAHFKTKTKLDPALILKGCNALLPRDIRLLNLEPVPLSFHAQFDAKRKLYRYTIVRSQQVLPQERFFVYHYTYPLDVKAMRKGSRYLIGTHDFASFQGSNAKPQRKNTQRTIDRFDLIPKKDRILFEIQANGFLYTMVRTIVGTLLEVGIGKRTPESLKELLKKRDRRLAGPAIPAKGLCLVRVEYATSDIRDRKSMVK